MYVRQLPLINTRAEPWTKSYILIKLDGLKWISVLYTSLYQEVNFSFHNQKTLNNLKDLRISNSCLSRDFLNTPVATGSMTLSLFKSIYFWAKEFNLIENILISIWFCTISDSSYWSKHLPIPIITLYLSLFNWFWNLSFILNFTIFYQK